MNKREIDVAGFKKGLSALMESHGIASFRTWGPSGLGQGLEVVPDGVDLTGLSLIGAHPGELLVDVIEPRVTTKRKFAMDVVGLFQYYNVKAIYPGAKHFFIGFDDGGIFKFENVIIKGVDENEAHYSF